MNWGALAGLREILKFSDVMYVISPPSDFPEWGRPELPQQSGSLS